MVGSIGNLGSSTGGLGSRCTKECGYCCEEWQYSDLIGQWHVSDEILLEVDPICSEMCILKISNHSRQISMSKMISIE